MGCTSVVFGLDIGEITGVKGGCPAPHGSMPAGAHECCARARGGHGMLDVLQVRVLELENQLQKERQKLGELRKKHYELAGVAEGWEEDGEWIPVLLWPGSCSGKEQGRMGKPGPMAGGFTLGWCKRSPGIVGTHGQSHGDPDLCLWDPHRPWAGCLGVAGALLPCETLGSQRDGAEGCWGHRVAPHPLTLSPLSSCGLTPAAEAACRGHPHGGLGPSSVQPFGKIHNKLVQKPP